MEGFIAPVINNTKSFYRVGLQQFRWAKKIQGTKCIVSRINKSSKVSKIFGSIVSSTLNDDEDREEFNYVVLINLADMVKLYQKSINQLQIYDNEDTLKLGDNIRFTSGGQEFQFKIIEVQTFSETGGVLNQYTLSGLTEVDSYISEDGSTF